MSEDALKILNVHFEEQAKIVISIIEKQDEEIQRLKKQLAAVIRINKELHEQLNEPAQEADKPSGLVCI